MKFSELIFLTLKDLKNNKNNILMIFISILFYMIFLFYTAFNNGLKDYWENCLNRNIEYRTFFVYSNTVDSNNTDTLVETLKKYKHVVDAVPASSKSISCKVKKIRNEQNSSMTLIGTIDNPIKLTFGKDLSNYDNDNVMICPRYFYPYDYDKKSFNEENIIDLKNMVDDVFYLSPADSNDTVEFKLVGIYDNELSNNVGNYCYTKFSKVNWLNNKYLPEIYTESEEKILPVIVVIDSAKNVEAFLSKIQKDGFISGGTIKRINISDGENIINVLLLLCSFFIVVYCFMAIAINIKDYFSNQEKYGLYKTIGYTKNDILKIYILKEIVIMTCSTIISIILYQLLKNVFHQILLDKIIILQGIEVSLTWTAFVYLLLINVCILISFSAVFIYKTKNKNIMDFLSNKA